MTSTFVKENTSRHSTFKSPSKKASVEFSTLACKLFRVFFFFACPGQVQQGVLLHPFFWPHQQPLIVRCTFVSTRAIVSPHASLRQPPHDVVVCYSAPRNEMQLVASAAAASPRCWSSTRPGGRGAGTGSGGAGAGRAAAAARRRGGWGSRSNEPFSSSSASSSVIFQDNTGASLRQQRAAVCRAATSMFDGSDGMAT